MSKPKMNADQPSPKGYGGQDGRAGSIPLMRGEFDFERLVAAIQRAHTELAAQAGRAVNLSLTLRNWLIGCYIAEYELNGHDRATYGAELLARLAKRLAHLSNCNRLARYR